jgi:peptide/nickel transport system permease protein
MWKLIVSRSALTIPLLFMVAVTVFTLFCFIPVDPVKVILSDEGTAEAQAQLRAQLGLDRPAVEQFFSWLGNALTGDLGRSYVSQEAVTTEISERLPVTVALAFGGTALAVGFGITAGVIGAVRPNSPVDRVLTAIVSVFLSIPGFWLALMLVLVFAVKVQLLPVAGYTPFSTDPAEWLRALILPWIAVGLRAGAVIARQCRSALVEALESTYVRALKSQGTAEWRIVLVYGLKNAMVPVLAMIGIEISVIVGASALIEQIFSLPGLGTLLLNGILRGDMPVLQGAVMVMALIIVLINLLVDIGYGLVDPRVRPQ